MGGFLFANPAFSKIAAQKKSAPNSYNFESGDIYSSGFRPFNIICLMYGLPCLVQIAEVNNCDYALVLLFSPSQKTLSSSAI